MYIAVIAQKGPEIIGNFIETVTASGFYFSMWLSVFWIVHDEFHFCHAGQRSDPIYTQLGHRLRFE